MSDDWRKSRERAALRRKSYDWKNNEFDWHTLSCFLFQSSKDSSSVVISLEKRILVLDMLHVSQLLREWRIIFEPLTVILLGK